MLGVSEHLQQIMGAFPIWFPYIKKGVCDLLSESGAVSCFVDSVASSSKHSVSYLAKDWPKVEIWQTKARAKVFELLAFTPPKTPLSATVEGRREEDQIIVETISYDMPNGPRTRGFSTCLMS